MPHGSTSNTQRYCKLLQTVKNRFIFFLIFENLKGKVLSTKFLASYLFSRFCLHGCFHKDLSAWTAELDYVRTMHSISLHFHEYKSLTEKKGLQYFQNN